MKKNKRQFNGNCLWKENNTIGGASFILYAFLIFEIAIMSMYYYFCDLKKLHGKELPIKHHFPFL